MFKHYEQPVQCSRTNYNEHQYREVNNNIHTRLKVKAVVKIHLYFRYEIQSVVYIICYLSITSTQFRSRDFFFPQGLENPVSIQINPGHKCGRLNTVTVAEVWKHKVFY